MGGGLVQPWAKSIILLNQIWYLLRALVVLRSSIQPQRVTRGAGDHRADGRGSHTTARLVRRQLGDALELLALLLGGLWRGVQCVWLVEREGLVRTGRWLVACWEGKIVC